MPYEKRIHYRQQGFSTIYCNRWGHVGIGGNLATLNIEEVTCKRCKKALTAAGIIKADKPELLHASTEKCYLVDLCNDSAPPKMFLGVDRLLGHLRSQQFTDRAIDNILAGKHVKYGVFMLWQVSITRNYIIKTLNAEV